MNRFRIDGSTFPQPAAPTARDLGGGRYAVPAAGGDEPAFAVAHGDTVYLQLLGRAWRVERVDPTASRSAIGDDAEGLCRAPMPGVVIAWLAQPGQVVSRGDALLVIESMKLQATIGAPGDGSVAEMPLAVGQTFRRGALLARVEAIAS